MTEDLELKHDIESKVHGQTLLDSDFGKSGGEMLRELAVDGVSGFEISFNGKLPNVFEEKARGMLFDELEHLNSIINLRNDEIEQQNDIIDGLELQLGIEASKTESLEKALVESEERVEELEYDIEERNKIIIKWEKDQKNYEATEEQNQRYRVKVDELQKNISMYEVYADIEPTRANDFDNICKSMSKTYREKNADYGNSFGDTFEQFGIISAIVRISDKFNRIKNIAKDYTLQVKDESIEDTLIDMASYCIMTVMELRKEK